MEAIREDANRSYEYGFGQGTKDEKSKVTKAEAEAVTINWNLNDSRARDEVTSQGLILSDDFYNDTNQKIQRVIAESFGTQRSIPSVVTSLREVVQTESWKLTRIARTEIINASNEGKLAGYYYMSRVRSRRNLRI